MRAAHGGAAALALALGVAGLTGAAAAQQPAPAREEGAGRRTGAEGCAGCAGAKRRAARAPGSSCARRRTAVTKDKDGKEEKKDLNICLTHHERLDGNTGMVLVSAAVRQVEGQDKQRFMVMVPLGMLLQPGMRAIDLSQGPVGEGAEEREGRREQAQGHQARLHAVPSRRLHGRDGGDRRSSSTT